MGNVASWKDKAFLVINIKTMSSSLSPFLFVDQTG